MPTVKANGLTINYDQQGAGEPLILIPFLTADCACYAFQIVEYSKHFTCITMDLRGTGESDKPPGAYSTELFADDVAAFMRAVGVERAHVAGLSLGAGVGMWLAAKYPEKVKTLSVHSGWTKTDPFLQTVLEGWRVMATALGSVPETVFLGIFPWCFTPGLYASKPDFIDAVKAFVKSRPAQPVESFMQHTQAVLDHDIEPYLAKIKAPAQITFGRYDMLTSTRFADRMKTGIERSEVEIFEDCAHAPNFEKIEEFNQRTLAFLKRHSALQAAG